MFFCQPGYGVIFLNYRGSTGFGDWLGQVEDMEVKDCHMARVMCLEKYPQLTRQKCVLMVGSQSNPSSNQKVTFNMCLMVNASQLCVGVAVTGREKFPAGGEGEEELFARNAEKSDCKNIELWIREKGLLATFNMKEVHNKINTDVEFGAVELSRR